MIQRAINYVPTETLFEQVNGAASEQLITVAVSLFNYERYLEECLDSIAAQRHQELDLIVVDDCSSQDNSQDAARVWMTKHAARFRRALFLRHRRNQGLSENRNTAFAHARSDLVFVMDADNSIYPRALSRLYEVMRGRRFAAAYTQLEFFGDVQRLGKADIWDIERFKTDNYVDAMALISKRAWEQVGGYSEPEGGWEDFDFWCKFVENELVSAFVPEILCRYRVHSAGKTITDTRPWEQELRVSMLLRHPWLKLPI